MVDPSLQGRCILVVEDEYLLADDLSLALTSVGARVLGPVPSVAEAKALIAGDTRVDGAILDINLRGDMIFPVADTLTERGIPFAFATGYDRWAVPERFAAIPHVEKPFKMAKIVAVLGPMLGTTEDGA